VQSFQNTQEPCVVDLLLELADAPDAAVRAAVATALAWVRGDEATRARERVPKFLEDESPRVRRVAALFVGTPLRAPAHVPLLLAALARETDFSAAYALVRSILALDADGGRGRIDKVLETAPPSTRDVVRQALDLHDSR
jgi:HEAT repeat protein